LNDKQFSEINKKLSLIIKLLATEAIKDKDYRKQVELLSVANLPMKDIADLTGKSVNNVKVTLHHIRKLKKAQKRGKKNER
jgi:DNA-directed RNA polymerase specialized sigma24 family protein